MRTVRTKPRGSRGKGGGAANVVLHPRPAGAKPGLDIVPAPTASAARNNIADAIANVAWEAGKNFGGGRGNMRRAVRRLKEAQAEHSAQGGFEWTQRADDELQAYVAGGMSSATIAARLGTDAETVDRRILERGLSRPWPTVERRAR
jgi:hypothetical protein